MAHAHPVQRLFTMFPPGLPGLALLLLRGSVAIAVLLGHEQRLAPWVHGVSVVLSVVLCAGYLTPVTAALSFGFHALVWSTLGVDGTTTAMVVALDSLALALLGPGAYSVDAYLFGRRVVVLPPSSAQG